MCMYIVDIDDQIQLHDYIFSRSFKWFIALNLNSEYIYRQYTGVGSVCVRVILTCVVQAK